MDAIRLVMVAAPWPASFPQPSRSQLRQFARLRFSHPGTFLCKPRIDLQLNAGYALLLFYFPHGASRSHAGETHITVPEAVKMAQLVCP